MAAKIIKLVLLVLSVITLHSCNSYEKMIITAPKESKVAYPIAGVKQKATTTANNDIIKLSIPSEAYCGYIIVTDPQTGMEVPYGLNLKRKKYTGEYIKAFVGIFPPFSLMGFGYKSFDHIGDITRAEQFTYQKKQYVDYGQLSTTLLHPDPEKEAIVESVATTKERTKATSGTSVSSTTATGSKANKTKSDNAKKVSGTYNGTGKLLYGNKTDENYSDISIVVERIDKDHVSVIILESGEEFFSEPLIYTIASGKGNSYSLKIENVPEATMTIDSAGKCAFVHKQVIIDGEIYTLSINAAKE